MAWLHIDQVAASREANDKRPERTIIVRELDGGYEVGELTGRPASAATRFATVDHAAYITSIVFPEGIPQLPGRPFAVS